MLDLFHRYGTDNLEADWSSGPTASAMRDVLNTTFSVDGYFRSVPVGFGEEVNGFHKVCFAGVIWTCQNRQIPGQDRNVVQ